MKFRLSCCLIALVISSVALSCSNQAGIINQYIGQKAPSLEPQVFAPGMVSSPEFTEYSGTFSSDFSEYYYYRFSTDTESKLLFTKVVDGKWTDPQPCSFSEGYAASEPHLTLDNKRLYFMWDYPIPQGQPGHNEQLKYFFVERTPAGWSEPRYAGQGMFMSSTRIGQIYLTDMSSIYIDGSTYLSKVTVQGNLFTNYEKLNIQPYFRSQAHPCVAPDGSFILFDVSEGSHLFVSFKTADGAWGQAVDLAQYGISPAAGGASISPDGKYLFFSQNDDIWWVDIKIIENLKT